ncbi:MAG: type II CAAX endopeptidase family protein [Gemmatimonadaceae bacterium]
MKSAQRSLVAFFAAVYAVTWTAFIAAAASTGAFRLPLAIPEVLRWPLLLVGAFAPSAVAIVLTAREQGRAGVRQLLRRLLQWRVGWIWFVFALCFLATVKLTAAVAFRLASGAWPAFGTYPAWYVVLLTSLVAMILGGPLGEEIGWRGFALPRLQQLMGERSASVTLGLLWALWHWPVFFIPGLDQYGQPFGPYVLYVTGLSVAFAFLYRTTGGSLLLAVLFHTAVNQSKDIVVTRLPDGFRSPLSFTYTGIGWTFLGVLWLCALVMLTRWPSPASANEVTTLNRDFI